MIRRILKHTNPKLGQISEEADLGKINKLFQDMKDTCIANNGIGLAAIQIGIPKRVALIKPQNKKELLMINPTILDAYKKDFESKEGCLSAPGIFGKVTRFEQVTVEWTNIKGNIKRGIFEGLEACIVQHEIDHLNGILCLDKFEK